MTSHIAGEILSHSVANSANRANGRRRQILMFESSRVADQIGDINALPTKPNNIPIQNAAGEFLFIPGYSEVGGGDIIE